MQWYDKIFELIDLRSFSNLWYWLGLSIFWSTVGHWVLGVPHDMIRRAENRDDPHALHDVEALAAIYVRRLLFITRTAGVWLVAGLSFVLSGLGLLAVAYRVEFAQALLCLLLPATVIFLLTLRTARLIEAGDTHGPALLRRLRRHRMVVQIMGMVAIFLTAVFGMYQNMLIGVYG
ncbi:component of SufBCD complex [Paragemmobacter straminiformis]|uniref:Component of SufBCD complex n=1 Tax=Paragemmobacter straminiformis TaxID=2045119 RepID=A0A842I7F9_9RHOB|nr:component of SufBCD complex [Gemmobacter straminiformis]MBC2835555.1 component of SufBCD complex [Gemmobacter straminiformis]